jgi:hypothetical protein
MFCPPDGLAKPYILSAQRVGAMQDFFQLVSYEETFNGRFNASAVQEAIERLREAVRVDNGRQR